MHIVLPKLHGPAPVSAERKKIVIAVVVPLKESQKCEKPEVAIVSWLEDFFLW
jgi:hypothetical protein